MNGSWKLVSLGLIEGFAFLDEKNLGWNDMSSKQVWCHAIHKVSCAWLFKPSAFFFPVFSRWKDWKSNFFFFLIWGRVCVRDNCIVSYWLKNFKKKMFSLKGSLCPFSQKCTGSCQPSRCIGTTLILTGRQESRNCHNTDRFSQVSCFLFTCLFTGFWFFYKHQRVNIKFTSWLWQTCYQCW